MVNLDNVSIEGTCKTGIKETITTIRVGIINVKIRKLARAMAAGYLKLPSF
jgi:hypothetical protein